MKKNIFLILLIFLLCIFTSLNASCKPKYFSDDSGKSKVSPDPIYSKTITIPQGYVLSVRTNEMLSTQTLSVPDKIYVHLNDDFYYKNNLIAPQGSIIQGMVVKSIKGNTQQEPQLLIKFTSIITPNEQIIPITAVIVTGDKNGILKGYKKIKQNSVIDIIIKQPITYIPI